VKSLLRLMVTSSTYRQAATATPEKLTRDPYNRLFTRGPRLRLDAEYIRDNALAVSGLLNPKIGGASVKPYQPPGIWDGTDSVFVQDHGQDLYRRGMYVFWRRSAHYPSFATFDAPNRETCTVKRSRTNTPLQALALLNETTFVETAHGLASRMLGEGGTRPPERIAHGFRLAIGRQPTAEELATLVEGYEADLAKFSADPVAAEKYATVGLVKKPEAVAAPEFAAYSMAANVIINLDEFVMRE
jgi:hypothetical protein